MMLRFVQYTLGLLLAATLVVGAAAPPAQAQTMDDKLRTFVLFHKLEYVPEPDGRPIGLEATSWIGGDVNRAWLRAEGEQSTLHREGEVELEALYGRLVSPFFDAVAGVRVDRAWGAGGKTRAHLAVGLQGLAPYQFEVEPTLYVSQKGNVTAGFAASYHVLFTQRLKLESELETSAALQAVPEWGVGSGVNDLGLGARLRYELHRKFAPYVGYDHHWAFGETADLAGEHASSGAFVFGVRIWR
ncbi:copper resistance protein B [Salinibacter ruber]|jgi:copper resistance protein B|uniref:Copper resistance protein B n=2 Tax=Salinibacter ruber TaxID=146919 RepID=A0A9X2V3A3_9BACT|nr:copper resistance protein B [Salinibacter ruber]MCS3635946.1 copper resistance protein B [Salinibacter ruber]MCS3639183.1 copper resistance protein B [Salinibacter ruber]MCS3666401.1 copper resistance protein B [Salinibacter ruber]MCS3715286.1 copper resistance protein B [Salinibacter ruber]MCS4102762.1 copper resistance protein B [Salinibacter ruber]